MLLLLSADFFQTRPFQKNISGTPSDQDRQNDGPDLGPNCLQRFSAYNKSPLERKELPVKLKFHVGLSMAWFDSLRPSQQFFSHFGTGLNQ